MIFLLNVAIGLALAAFQISVVPRIPLLNNCYDLMLPFVVYQAVFRPARESIVLGIGAGVLMGLLSGAPRCLFLIVYLWVIAGVWWGVRFLHMGNYFLVPFVVALAVFLENAFFAFFVTVRLNGMNLPLTAGKTILPQVGWALISAPLFIMLLNAIHHGWRAWLAKTNTENGNAAR